MLPDCPWIEDFGAEWPGLVEQAVGEGPLRRRWAILLPGRQPTGEHPSTGVCTFHLGNGHADGVARQSCSIRITFCRPLNPDEYATAVLACQHALTMIGINEAATVWPDGTASDIQINEVSDRWLAGNPWAC
jgi:hypothetical protein